ncbi:uncharacterized protein LOC123217750 isoform X2 [Mangifera indica]|uniref:uncharacterized protein LOC123217750 isoform X2 n=1 Tax=Mangifera indica TaxID=29780 RepID=UPI001CFB06A3|nr:uncharacterized protein LOC123217750 isoform X2 [Mangifera indica]
MPGRPNRRGRGNARRLNFPPDYVPEGWIIINEINEDGIEERFIKVATNETFHSREDMLRYVAYEREANQPAPAPRPIQPLVFCNRCRNIGHEAHQCGYSEAYVMAINALYPRPAPAPEPERR